MNWLRVIDRRSLPSIDGNDTYYTIDFCEAYTGTDAELAQLAWGFLRAGMNVEVI